ncbi:hypothetical protein CASFOL_021260 [Castilleja foliolosa]|uniref:RING-type domain-containing protein n=1 Tax=Castilleja foliolosa TaxID=1961234 RepID=A0ABD3CW28_9LAMI
MCSSNHQPKHLPLTFPTSKWHFPPLLPVSTAPPPPLASIIYTAVKPTSDSHKISSIGLGYAIAIALSFLVLLSIIVLSSYICCRSAAARRRRHHTGNPNPNIGNENGIYLPRVIFVAEDDDSESQNAGIGLDQAVINSYPKLTFSKRGGNWPYDAVCAICLCEYRESETLRMLTDCRHCFHVMCVDAWLKLNASCPVCRSSPLPTPLSTPLQEVVPLSQYSDGRRR